MPYREGQWQWVARAPHPAGAKATAQPSLCEEPSGRMPAPGA